MGQKGGERRKGEKKIKLAFTEKFLWGLFNLFEEKEEILKDPLDLKKRIPSFSYQRVLGLYQRKRTRQSFHKFIFYLKSKDLIKVNLKDKNHKLIKLTPKALRKIYKLKLIYKSKLKRDKAKRLKNDQKILIIFDIPEEKRKTRNNFRRFLYLLGYKRIQKSVFINSLNVIKETQKLIKIFSLDRYVEVFLIDKKIKGSR